MRHPFAANLDWLGLLCWNGERAACFERLPGRFPPAFPFRFGKDIANEPFPDLLRAGFAVQTLQNILDQGHWVFPGQILEWRNVRCLSDQKMFGSERRKIFPCVLRLHRMRLLAGEINHDLTQQEVPFTDPAEPPALVQAKCAWLQLFQLAGGFSAE